MELQSRFGTDERFRMDSRFLEDDEEEEHDKAESGVATYLDLMHVCMCIKVNKGIANSIITH